MARATGRWGGALGLTFALVLAVGCHTDPAAETAAETAAAAASGAPATLAVAIADTTGPCPVTGAWTVCLMAKRMERSGLSIRIDTTPAHERGINGSGLLLHVARGELALYFYPDTASRAAAEKFLNVKDFIGPDANPSARNERTMLRSMNLLGLMAVGNEANRERIANNVLAGPPQPPRDTGK